MAETEPPLPDSAIDKMVMYMERISRDIRVLRNDITKVVVYMEKAERLIPEEMRRFIMYYHDVHDIRHLYHEHGLEPPPEVNSEIERCADQFVQMIREYHSDGGVFEKSRADLAEKAGNYYNHTRKLAFNKPKE